MDLIDNILGMVAKHFKLDAFVPRLDAIKGLGKGKGLDVPDELVALNLDMLSRSLYNIMAIQPNADWVWPYWAEKQYDQKDKSFLPSSYLSINLTHRNWTGISSVGADREAIVDPRGLLTPLFDGWSLDHWVLRDDELVLPSRLDRIEQRLVNRAPIVKSTFYKKNVKVISEALMFDAGGEVYIEAFYHVEPWEDVSTPLSFYLAVRPYNPESVVPVTSIEYLPEENAFLVNGKDRLHLDLVPDRVYCGDQDSGDAFFKARPGDAAVRHKATDPSGLCTAFAEFKRRVDGKTPFALKTVIAQSGKKVPKEVLAKRHSQMRMETVELWENRKAGSCAIKTPDSRINEAFEASKNNLLILVDSEEVTPGPFTYHKMWFRDAAYTVTALLKLGFIDDAKRILEFYFRKQTGDGYFESQNGEWDSNGQVLWTICQYFRFTGDRDFMERRFKALAKGAEWVFKTRKKEAKDSAGQLHEGLLPPGYSAEHFGPSNYYYWDDFWAYGGIRELVAAGRVLGKDMDGIEKENEAFLADIEKSIKATQDKRGDSYLPSSPYRRTDCSLIGTVAALYPLQIFPPERADLRETLRIIRKSFMGSGAFFHKLLHSGYNVYLTAHIAECYVLGRSTLALPVLDWILDHATDTWTFPEAIHPETGGGCMGDGHHGWATSELIHLIRNLLFVETGDSLCFFPVIPHSWLELGNLVEVTDAPSAFGLLDFSLRCGTDHLTFNVRFRGARPPKRIELNMPVKIMKIRQDGVERAVEARSCELEYREEMEVEIVL